MKVALGLALAVGLTTLAGAQAQHAISPAELMSMTNLSDPQLSPNGGMVAYVRDVPSGKCAGQNSQIWLVPSDGSVAPRAFILGGSSNTSPEWAPDGRTIAFLSNRELPPLSLSFRFRVAGSESGQDLASETESTRSRSCRQPQPSQIWTISIQGGDALPLTAIAGGVSGFRWSPDGKQIAFVRNDRPDAKTTAARHAGNDQTVEDEHYLFSRLWIFDLETHSAHLLTKEAGSIYSFAWSPDGSQILARTSPTTHYNDRWYISKLALIDVHTGAEKMLVAHAGGGPVSWSPDGHTILYSMRLPHGIAELPAVRDLATGATRMIGANYPATIGDLHWEPNGQELLGMAIQGSSNVFLKVNAKTGAITPVSGAAGGEEFSLSKDGRKVAFVCATPSDPGDICVAANGREQVLTKANPQVKQWLLPNTRQIQWKSTLDGTRIYGVLLLPPGYRTGQRYPTVVWVHGGPEEAYVTDFHGSWYDWMVMLASHGYVVLLPNPRGSDGQGPAFADANYQKWGDGDFQDIMDGVTQLEKQGIADPARLGIGGWSYGGYMTAWTITHTDRFKVAMMGAGISDLVSAATTSDIAPSYWSNYWGQIVGAEDLLYRHSPERYLANCHTPVLIVVGGADARVTAAQSYEFYHGLQDLGRHPVMVVYPREHHIFQERPHRIDSLTRMLNWYESHLRP
ncbi:MAG: S9 family peptidase [Acidobacteria bacterium]|nr:MAG: S9 family peptidase [Acidobacteriota bacterium]